MGGGRLRLMVSAGEASGDAHAAEALAALRARGVDAECFGMGASRLAAEGVDILVDCADLAVIGIVDVLANYPRFRARLATLRRALERRRPDLLLIVDYPDFNLRLAESARALGVPVLFYISPQVWAWRPGRIRRIAALVDHMAVLFPFEVPLYERAGVPVTHVGHPLVDDARSPLSREEARARFGLEASGPLVTLLPGSRRGELRRHLGIVLESAARLRDRVPGCRFLLPLAPTLSREDFDAALDDADLSLDAAIAARDLPLQVVAGDARHAMRAADAVLVASGTATLETALIGTPMIVLYVVARLNHAILSRLIRIPDIALVNVVAGRRVVPEYVQEDARPEALAAALETLLSDADAAAAQRAALGEVRERLGEGGASARVAALLESMLREGRSGRALDPNPIAERLGATERH